MSIGGILITVWVAWSILARVPVYEESPEAKLGVAGGVNIVQAPAAGPVLSSELAVGHRVEEGELLVKLDATEHEKRLAEKRVELTAIAARLQALDRLRDAELQAVEAVRQVASAAVTEAEAVRRAAEPRATLASERAERLQKMNEDKPAFSQAELAESKAEAASLGRSLDALARGVTRLRADHRFRVTDRQVELTALERDAVELKTRMEQVGPNIERLVAEIEKRRIRAPASGVIGEVSELRRGAFVSVGDRLFTVIPDGELRVVSYHPAWRALGRVAPGQPAYLQMHGFPWTQYGSVPAVVDSVGNEARDGVIRIELRLRDISTHVPLQHGLTATANIEVERISPAVLLLRAAGKLLGNEPNQPPPAPPSADEP